jgi:hypothetical protein
MKDPLVSAPVSILLIFTCPTTQRPVPVAVVRGAAMLAKKPDAQIEVDCFECGGKHAWKIREGRTAMVEPVDH